MKTVLIPTDFTLSSLNMVKQAAAFFEGERINIILFHGLHTPADIQDLLSISSRVPHEKITEPFRHTCAAIKKKYSETIAGISFQHLYGNTAAVFRNFIESFQVDYIFMPAHVQLQIVYPNSIDVRQLFKHSSIPFITNATAATHKSASYVVAKNLVLAEA